MRKCCRCGAEDREVAAPGEEPEHFVVPELRWLAGPMSKANEQRGWQFKMWQGKPAMVRSVCRPCLNAQALEERIWRELRSNARKLEDGSEERYYQDLCEG